MVLHRWGRCKQQATNSVFGCDNISNEHDCNGIFPHSAINYEGLVSYGGFFASTAAITSSKRRDALLEASEYQHMQQDDWWKHIELDFTDDHHNRWWDACHTSVVFAGLSANCGTAPTLCRVYISTRSQIVIRREGT
jgi:hypothetical protein